MSNATHKVLRMMQQPRKPRVRYESGGPGRRTALVGQDGKGITTTSFHRQGDQWWRNRKARQAAYRKADNIIKGIANG